MNFNTHSDLKGLHAFLGPSKYHWINYDEEKLEITFKKFLAIQKGTELHEFAKECIRLKIKLPKSKRSLNSYVNDAIGFHMKPEQVLYYSQHSFGTADAISFKDGLLRIHDLKTGVSPTSMRQLEIYACLFCLEYDFNPREINTELRIYQSDEVLIHIPDDDDLLFIIDKIKIFDKKIEKLCQEEE